MQTIPRAIARVYETCLMPRLGWPAAVGDGDELGLERELGLELGLELELGWAALGDVFFFPSCCLIASGRTQMRRLSLHGFLGSLDQTGTRTGRTRLSHWS